MGRALTIGALLSGPAGAFSVHDSVVLPSGLDIQRTILETARWAAEPVNGTGLHDGIQVGVAAGFTTALGAAPGEIPLAREAIVKAFDAWANGVLFFEVTFDANLATESYEITLDTFDGAVGLNQIFGFASWSSEFVPDRLLTNGQRHDGWVLTHADIGVNAPNVRSFREQFGPILNDQLVADALQRLLMHEAGHAIGLGHPTVDPFNFDTDLDPFNAMPIDPLAPWTGLFDSPNSDADAIMSGLAYGSSFLALFDTFLHTDDAGGRDALYPIPEPSTGLLVLIGALCLVAPPRLRRRRTPSCPRQVPKGSRFGVVNLPARLRRDETRMMNSTRAGAERSERKEPG